METWKDIVGYEGLYLISNTGKVLSPTKVIDGGLGRKTLRPETTLRPAPGSHGYLAVSLCKNKKHVSTCIHRILAEAFIPNPHGYRCINHKDGNKLNNDLNNLEWVSHGTNNKHAYDTGLKKPCWKVSPDQVEEMRDLFLKNYRVCDLARMYNIESSTVSLIVNYKSRLNG